MEKHKFDALDGLRGIFAVFVAFYHFKFMWHLHGTAFLESAYMAVDFFFVLSGFVITHATWGQLKSGRDGMIFAIRRFGRVWPLHAAVLGGMVALEGAKMLLVHGAGASSNNVPFDPAGETSPLAVGANLLLVQGLNIFDQNTWNGPSWSISTEFYTYMLFALVVIVAGARFVPVAAGLIGIAMAGLVAYAPTMDTSFDFGFLRCVAGFFMGCLVYRIWKWKPKEPIFKAKWVEWLCVALLVLFPMASYAGKASLLAPVIFALPVLVFAYQQGTVSGLLQTRVVQYLGRLSYAIYIVHYPIFIFVSQVVTVLEKKLHVPLKTTEYLGAAQTPHEIIYFGNMWVMDGVVVVCVLLSVGVAAVASWLVENPARRYFNGLSKRI